MVAGSEAGQFVFLTVCCKHLNGFKLNMRFPAPDGGAKKLMSGIGSNALENFTKLRTFQTEPAPEKVTDVDTKPKPKAKAKPKMIFGYIFIHITPKSIPLGLKQLEPQYKQIICLGLWIPHLHFQRSHIWGRIRHVTMVLRPSNGWCHSCWRTWLRLRCCPSKWHLSNIRVICVTCIDYHLISGVYQGTIIHWACKIMACSSASIDQGVLLIDDVHSCIIVIPFTHWKVAPLIHPCLGFIILFARNSPNRAQSSPWFRHHASSCNPSGAQVTVWSIWPRILKICTLTWRAAWIWSKLRQIRSGCHRSLHIQPS